MKKLRTDEIIDLITYTVNKVIPKELQEFREVEIAVIIAKINEITKTKKKNLNQAQALEVIYKELGVDTI